MSAPRRRATPAQLVAARRLLEDGASYREAAVSTRVGRNALMRALPGYGWTYPQAGAYTATLRAARRDTAAAGIAL